MIFNAHSHIMHENSSSELYKESFLNSIAKALNVSKEVLLQNPDPNFVINPDAKDYVKSLDDAGIDDYTRPKYI